MDPDSRSHLQYLVFLALVVLLVFPLGRYMAEVFGAGPYWARKLLGPIEAGIYRVCGVDPEREQTWKEYALSFLLFTFIGVLVLYGILRLQQYLPLYDAKNLTTPMTPDLAANTAVSFATTSTWQAYGGEATMSYASQMLGLCAQNFMAGAAGLAVGVAFIRGFSRERAATLGNFWVDLTRAALYVLLPLSLVGGVALLMLGVPMNFSPYAKLTTLEGGRQVFANGPVAALEIIKNLGTNGGGFFNANAAHPFETPNNAVNLINLLAIAALPAALTRTFGLMVKRTRDGWVLLGVMVVLFTAGLAICDHAERTGNPTLAAIHLTGGNFEGKETRFGIGGSVLAAVTTSNGATGSTNSSHDSYTPIGGLVPLGNMLLGEMIFGGLGTGIYSIVFVALLGLFLCGLMVGRTPEYLGKSIAKYEVQLVVLYTLACPILVLTLSALAVLLPQGLAGLTTNTGAHGLTEIFYAYTSSFANNGQSFAGLSANSPFYNFTTAAAMMGGRFLLAVPALAIAGAFAHQGRKAFTKGTLPTDGFTFAAILAGTALLVTGLSFLPAVALGPIVEQYQMEKQGREAATDAKLSLDLAPAVVVKRHAHRQGKQHEPVPETPHPLGE
jgi:K+-transporting ATPase ATPase A chain